MKRIAIASVLALVASSALAEVHVADPWVRATVPQQRSTGAFMHLTSTEDARLIAARSPAAKVVEVHEMKMEGEVMKMRAVEALDLPAGKMVQLKPGGYHVMLIDLNAQVKEGDMVPLTLVVESKAGTREEIELNVPARPLNQTMQPGGHPKMKH